jgi:hypothetical protein
MQGTRTILVKVQLALASNEARPMALVYDEGREFEAQVPVTSSIRKKMAGATKKFFYATVSGNDVALGASASWRSW